VSVTKKISFFFFFFLMGVPTWCIKVLAGVGPFILLGCLGLIAGANFEHMLEYGYGDVKNKVYVWRVCFAAIGDQQAKCVAIGDDSVCSELTSKMNVVGIMSCISGFNNLLTIISVFADLQGCKVPVKNLTTIFFAWSIIPTILAVAVAVMAMVNAQCGATQSLSDQEGSYGPGFQMLAASFFGMVLGLAIHLTAMFFIGSTSPVTNTNEDSEEEDEML
jgi:hypothetical protein